MAAPKLVVGHSCVASWWRAVHGAEPPQAWDRYRRRVQEGLLAADAVVAPSAAMLGELEALYGVTGGLVIHNGSAALAVAADVEKRPLVLGAGRFWDPAKNLVALDEAAGRLSWPVVLAGDLGAGEPPRQAASTGLLAATALAALRRDAAIFAAPARYEPFGLAILEAARARCALVLGDIPSLRELWADAAVFVDPLDPGALHAALEALIGDGARRRELAARAQRRSLRLGIDRAARAYRRLYARLAHRTGLEVPA
jgi:glycosyltransferase involved in cell wall biosynthesis